MLGADQAALPTTVAAHMGGLVFADTGGTFTHVQTAGEQGDIKVSSDGDDEGANFSQGIQPFTIVIDAGELVYECRFKTSTITDTKHGIFLGLMESHTQSATVPIAAAGTLADANFVGFHRLESADNGEFLDTVYKANGITQVTVKANAHTLVADTYVKVGMVFNRDNDNILTFYVNGHPLPDTYTMVSGAGTDFPNEVQLGVFYAVLNATGTTPGDTHLSWIRCAQRRAWVL